MKKLTDKQRIFCNEYIIDFNASAAALRSGYSKKTCSAIGPENLRKPIIQQTITEMIRDRESRTKITQDRVLIEIARLAFNDPRKVFQGSGQLKDIKDWPDDVAACISSVKIIERSRADDDSDKLINTEVKEIKFWDKGRQLELAAKHLGMLNEKPAQEEVIPESYTVTIERKNARITQ